MIELLPADSSYAVKVVVYADPAEAWGLKSMLDLKAMDFKVSYKIPGAGSYVRDKIDRLGVRDLRVEVIDEGNIRIMRR